MQLAKSGCVVRNAALYTRPTGFFNGAQAVICERLLGAVLAAVDWRIEMQQILRSSQALPAK
jgi:hypothetical protein